MPRISPNTIAQVHDYARSNVLEIIGDFLTLKRKGQNHWAKSPFANEKTPSFAVSPSKGIWKDFSTGKGGGAVSFLMDAQGMTYVEAIEHIAGKAGITIEREGDAMDPADLQQMQAKAAIKEAAALFVASMNDAATEYCQSRGISQEAIARFGIGYAPQSYDFMLKVLQKAGTSIQSMESAGLIGKSESGSYYDRFRGRLMFPIHDHLGTMIGFGGRLIGQSNGPKYLNSPETCIYNKSKVLYGLHIARREAARMGQFILTEGYTDAITLHMNGRPNAVASCGTALTPQQCELMRRTCNNVLVVRDSDSAGIAATEKDVRMLLRCGLVPSVLPLASGQDPDSFCRSVGADGFAAHEAANSRPFVLFLFRMGCKRNGTDAGGKAKAVHEAMEAIQAIPDTILRQMAIKELASLSGLSEASIARSTAGTSKGQQTQDIASDSMLPHERGAMRVMVNGEPGPLVQSLLEIPASSMSADWPR